MPTHEEEYYRLMPLLRRICNFFLWGKKLIIEGEENFVKAGGNIIVGNHIGSFKDVSLLFRIVSRPIFFTANKNIFNRKDFSKLVRKHLRRHMGKLGVFLNDPLANNGSIELWFDGKQVEYQFGELDEVALAYAVSIHKS